MTRGGAAVPEQPECGVQRQPLPAAVLSTARLPCQAVRLSGAQTLVLTVMGQL
jgi:hypothetical protein